MPGFNDDEDGGYVRESGDEDTGFGTGWKRALVLVRLNRVETWRDKTD